MLRTSTVKSNNRKFLTTFKKLTIFLLINFTAIELFTGYVTLKSIKLAELMSSSPDFTPLVTLIGAVIGETLSFAIYAAKSAKENCEKGITYLNAQHQMEMEKMSLEGNILEDQDSNICGESFSD